MLDAIRGLIALVAAIGIVAVIAGFFGRVHPAFDTLGAFRLQALAAFGGVFLFAMVFRALTARYLALIGAMFAAAGLAPSLLPEDPVGAEDMRVFVHNLRFDHPEPALVAAAIRGADADVVLLQEVSDRTRLVIDALDGVYRTEIVCDYAGIGAVAVLARYPLIGASGCARGQGVAWARLRTPWGPATVASVHLPWPWPYGQQAGQSERVAGILAELDEPILIGGDFNNAPWAQSVARIAEATGTRVLRGLHLTFTAPEFWPGLPIDHVLVSEDLAAEVKLLDTYGSDHRALLTGVRFLRPGS